jgi:phage terminase large subunit
MMNEPAPDTEPEWEFTEETEFLFEPHRYKVGHGGRGGVKSWSWARALLIQGWESELRIGCFREVQKSIKDSVHTLLGDQIKLMGLEGFYEVLTHEIRGKNGSAFIFSGLSNLTAATIKSYEGLDRAWVEEAQAVTRRSWDILVPTIRKDGSEIWVTFNPELDTDETFVRLVEDPPSDAYVQQLSWRENPWFPEVLKQERENFLRQVEQGKRTQEDYDNIWEGKCRSSVEGAIYPDEIRRVLEDKRLRNVNHDGTLKVHAIWDLGWNDKMAIGIVQTSPGEVRLIDYIEDSHRTYESYVDELLDKPYAKGFKDFYLPHDAKAANAQTGKSTQEIVIELLKAHKRGDGIEVELVPDIGVKPGIEAARQMFVRVYFDKANCTPLFNRLRRYARVISPQTEEAGKPKHDENSHGADMFRYLAVVENQLSNEDETFEDLNYDTRGIV